MITPAQRRALNVLVEATKPLSPREVAQRLWPESPGWQKRTRGRSGNRNGSLGGTMPMLAAKLLWRLSDQGLATQAEYAYLWEPTEEGFRTTSTGVTQSPSI